MGVATRANAIVPRLCPSHVRVAWLAALLCVLVSAAPAAAEEKWAVKSGAATLAFNLDLLRDLGIEVEVTGASNADVEGINLDEPYWTFPILGSSDLQFRTSHSVVLPQGGTTGAIRLGGVLVLRDRASGRESRFDDLEIVDISVASMGTSETSGPEPLLLRSAGRKLVFAELKSAMFDFRGRPGLEIHYLNMHISQAWARSIGRPDLAGWVVGAGEVRAASEKLSGVVEAEVPYTPEVTGGGILDVSLGRLEDIQSVGHDGTFPTGTAALSMSTTSCNLGSIDVPWLAPMQENHPLIHMAIYRLLDNRFEQIGVSWMKHGFFALSNNQCTPCQHPSNGTFLGVGCSDTYDVNNNSTRTYLGPRSEVNVYAGTWECTGSHFSGGVQDCTRRHSSSGHGVLDHRLVAKDADLNNPGATYFYEAYYVVKDDTKLNNNWGSRACTMSWNGSAWVFNTPTTGNALLAGPAINRWGTQLAKTASGVPVAPDDGEVVLAVQTTDLGNGTWHYEYALMNKNSDRQIGSFSLPVLGVANITNIGFHDNDANPATDWQVTVDGSTITWQTEAFGNPAANPLVFGFMYNFRFDADAPPSTMNSTLGLFKPGANPTVDVLTSVPTNSVAGIGDGGTRGVQLVEVRPNPFTHQTTIWYQSNGGRVDLSVYDAAGRLVRKLVEEDAAAGLRSVVWDGKGVNGTRVRSGAYYARLRAGSQVAVK
ncbi:MAG TPA: FlgD immunoglobulin-like domain containing protein, partial [Candidatus Eisenbacteria bacterium]|nr:FlgD immunoglobulin-like domain containing protein [Candidatus Eisenbacteria bacterium]